MKNETIVIFNVNYGTRGETSVIIIHACTSFTICQFLSDLFYT